MIDYQTVAELGGDFERKLDDFVQQGFTIVGYSAVYDPGLGNRDRGAITHCALLERRVPERP